MEKQLTLEILSVCMQIDEETHLNVLVSYLGKDKYPLNVNVTEGKEYILARSLHNNEEYYHETLALLKSILQEHRNLIAA
ncbi:hypothetical protein [Pontibacter beigongshangensis]|uniref:hypothetical protein n=1 Tax=Pontibacter beigongshangensis TaxID=2574733 RepID=UPI00164F9546|nr:hypothetical protein [Pontibacter beigongshangensis]